MYLSPIMDLCDRTILAYSLGSSPTTALTSQSLREAIDKHTPGHDLLVHTDQGIHYQHASWRQLITSIGATQSMSRKGNCYDNSVMENFFSHLKAEMFHGETFTSIEEFTQDITNYIHWYNNHRTQTRLKGLTPTQHRSQTLQAKAA